MQAPALTLPTEAPLEGDPGSFDDAIAALFRERFPMLYRYLKRVSGDATLADDVAQESFVRLHARGSMPADPGAWLVAVANNIVRDEYRTSKRRRRLLALWVQPNEESRSPPLSDAQLLTQERETTVRQALDMLPLRDRRLLILRHEGFSYREIAEALGVASSSIGTLLARATAALAQAYQGICHASD
jgi:RNA polymerase sigma-70 factor, ECF subfamily